MRISIFLRRRHCYPFPTLRSGAENIITLRFVTMGCREMRVGESDQDGVHALRLDGERDMKRYEHNLMVGNNLGARGSIVRLFSILHNNFVNRVLLYTTIFHVVVVPQEYCRICAENPRSRFGRCISTYLLYLGFLRSHGPLEIKDGAVDIEGKLEAVW